MLTQDILLDPANIPPDLLEFFEPVKPCGQCFVCHLVEVFRGVRRVLRPDGVLWLNMGDSYAGSGKGPSNSMQADASQIGPSAVKKRNPGQFANGQAPTSWLSVPQGLKPKDLMMMPARVAMALQADGWTLRVQIPWLKRNSMPESTDDRPATAVEYVYLLSKSNDTTFWTHRDHEGSRTRPAPDYRWIHKETNEEVGTDPGDPENWRRINLWRGRDYYWDADAVRVDQPQATIERYKKPFVDRYEKAAAGGYRGKFGGQEGVHLNNAGRNRRNSDWFFESWQGLMLDEQDDPLALVVNPTPFKGSHFAVFPPKLVEPMIKASTSEKGQCPECGAPWRRTVDYKPTASRQSAWNGAGAQLSKGLSRNGTFINGKSETTGWRPSCAHADLTPVPQTILDPFFGSGTVGLVADRLGHNAIGIDLKPDYAELAHDRVMSDAPMFTEWTA